MADFTAAAAAAIRAGADGVEVAAAVAAEIGPERTGLQISPGNGFNDISEADTAALYQALVIALAPLGLAYLSIAHQGDEELLAALRRLWPGALLLTAPARTSTGAPRTSTTGSRTSSPPGAPSSPPPTWSSACGPARRSTSPVPARSTAAANVATPTTLPWRRSSSQQAPA